MKKLINLGLFLFVLIFMTLHNGCRSLCGEAQGRQQVFIDSINTVYEGRLALSSVPCYPGYLRVDLKTPVEAKDLDSLETTYNRLIGFAELLVYDQGKNLIRGNTGSM